MIRPESRVLLLCTVTGLAAALFSVSPPVVHAGEPGSEVVQAAGDPSAATASLQSAGSGDDEPFLHFTEGYPVAHASLAAGFAIIGGLLRRCGRVG
jgi:hypothetical protein